MHRVTGGSAFQSAMPFALGAAADGPLPIGDMIAGGILTVAATIDIYNSYIPTNSRSTLPGLVYTQPDPTGFPYNKGSEGGGKEIVKWMIR